jgi:peptide/nickel transport system substrate-binding protein
MVVRYEVTDLAGKIPGSSSPVVTKRLFNAALALVDAHGNARPYLAASLPQLNTDSWKVSPDGRMETTYKLNPGLTWHDGQPLTADDFVFAQRVYGNRAFTIFTDEPQDRIENVSAPDPQTVVIQWTRVYPGAGALIFSDFDPLPRHILERAVAAVEDGSQPTDAFINLPFFTNDYVGAGPYKLERWTPGSQMEATAFAGHATGKPKIERMIVKIINDENAVLSTVLAGQADFTVDFTLRFEHGMVLKREWESQGKGTVVLKPSSSVIQMLQMRPEYVMHPGQLDVRVRKALAQTIDRQGLNEGLFEGQGFSTDNFVPPTVPYFPDVDRVIAKYPFDIRRADQYMTEAGFAKDGDGFYASPTTGRFKTDIRVTAGPEFERGQAIVMDAWRRAGFDVSGSILPAAQARDREARQTFPGMASRGGGLEERSFTSADIGSPANRWTGDNRGGWSNPEYDRIYNAFTTTIDQAERTRNTVQMLKLLSEELPAYPMYLALQVNTQVAGLQGPEPGTAGFGTMTPGTLPYWNIQDWELH